MRLALTGSLALVVTTALAHPADAKCKAIDCGDNSPVMKEFRFHELEETGALYNAEHLRIVGLWVNGAIFRPDVVGAHLVARDAGGAIVYENTALTGAYFELDTDTTPVQHFKIRIDEVYPTSLELWVDPTETKYDQYRLSWVGGVEPSTQWQPLCPTPPDKKTPGLEEQETYANPLLSVLYSGDRYSAEDKTVTSIDPERTANWFNVSCTSSAPYKLFMTRHTTVTSDAIHVSTADQRQAMLKMYVSDVCGNGDSFTKQGTPLHWNNFAGWGYSNSFDHGTEAAWDAHGAICLTEHRLGTEYLTDINACSQLHRCEDLFPGFRFYAPTTWPTSAYVISALPYAP